MILATYLDGLYKVFFLGHMISFLAAFAPAVIAPVLTAQVKADGDEGSLLRLAGHMTKNTTRIHFPALIALGGFGIAMVLSSDEVWSFGDAWVSLAFLVWLGIIGVILGLMVPAEKRLASGDLAAEKNIAVAGQIATVLLLVMLYLMIWKPGA
jgi:uncharacterized membrane protein